MKVYALIGCVEHERSTLCGVFSTLDGAKASATDARTSGTAWMYSDWFEIEECEIDGEDHGQTVWDSQKDLEWQVRK